MHVQPEDGHYQAPKHLVVLYVIIIYIYIYIYTLHSCVRQYIHCNIVYYKHNADDNPYDFLKKSIQKI